MAIAGVPNWSLRLERAESSRLAWALAISLLCHSLVFGGYYAGQRFHWWDSAHWPAWLQKAKILAQMFQKKETPPLQQQEVPLIFVEVNPAQATPEPPKDAKYYSNKNSRAANPEADKETDVPKITGTQKEVAKTEEVPREKFLPLQPSRPAAEPAPQEQPEMKAKPALDPGDLTLAKPDTAPQKDPGEAPHTRPRTLKDLLARQQDHQLPGQKMEQEGGVKRHWQMPSLDTKATPFGDYDAALVEAISKCWFTLLDDQHYAADYRGKVVLQFRLHSDGRITDLTVAENTAGNMAGWICRTAVDKPNPYPAFPSDMRRVIGETRDVQFTFYYN